MIRESTSASHVTHRVLEIFLWSTQSGAIWSTTSLQQRCLLNNGLWFLVIFEWSVAISPSCDIVSRGVQTPRYVALLLHLHSDFLPVQRDDEARCQNCTQPFCTVTFFLFRSTKLYTTILRRNPFLFRSIFNVLKITGSYMMETKIFLSQVFMN